MCFNFEKLIFETRLTRQRCCSLLREFYYQKTHQNFPKYILQFQMSQRYIMIVRIYILIIIRMRYLAVNGACCLLQVCCKEFWDTMLKLVGRERFVKLVSASMHLLVLVLTTVLIIMLKEWQWFMQIFASGITCITDSEFDCLSTSSLYRASFSLLMVDIIMIILLLVVPYRVGIILSDGLFCTKATVVIGIFLVTLQIQNSFFEVYGNFSQIFSYLFLIYQSIILIDLAYLWGIKWANQLAEGRQKYGFFLIAFTIIFYIASIGLNIYGYILDSGIEGQSCSNWPSILLTILLVLATGTQLLNFNKQNSLLTTSVICLFTSYWTIAAMQSEQSCYQLNQTTLFIHTAIGFVFVIMTTSGSIYGSTNQQFDNQFYQLRQDGLANPPNQNNVSEQSLKKQSRMWLKWHIYMGISSVYISMLLTDWGSSDIVNGQFNQTTNAFVSKIFICCLTSLFYIWTLLAPRLFPNRNFIFE